MIRVRWIIGREPPGRCDPGFLRALASRRGALACAAAACWLAGAAPGSAETLPGALARAYRANPALNAQRAGALAVNENLPQARSGYLPKIGAVADLGFRHDSVTGDAGDGRRVEREAAPRNLGLQLSQNLFDGGRTGYAVRQASLEIRAAHETVRNTEQNTLFDAVVAYVDVVRDTSVHEENRSYVELLKVHRRQARERHGFGEVTKTDIAQTEARLAGARAQLSLAEANLRASIAICRQVIGSEPRQLAPAGPVDRLLPPSLDAALKLALERHPAIAAALNGADAAGLRVRVVRGELYPRVDLVGSLTRGQGIVTRGDDRLSGSILGQLSIPIYDGGAISSRARQAGHVAGQRQLEADAIREQVRAAVQAGWARHEAAKARIAASQEQARAAETALKGVEEEYQIGARTTENVLDAQQDVLAARVGLISAQRDRIAASYAVAQAVGLLSLRAIETLPSEPPFRLAPAPVQRLRTAATLRGTLPTVPPAGCAEPCVRTRWALRPGL